MKGAHKRSYDDKPGRQLTRFWNRVDRYKARRALKNEKEPELFKRSGPSYSKRHP